MSEHLCAVPGCSETVTTSDSFCPSLDFVTLDLYRYAAVSTNEMMMMMITCTLLIDDLTSIVAKYIDFSGFGQRLQCPVHGGKSHSGTLELEHVVKFLGTLERSRPLEQSGYGGALFRSARLLAVSRRHQTVLHFPKNEATAKAAMANRTIVAAG